jgi:p24 family protein beta-1
LQLIDPSRKVLFSGLRQNAETYTFAAEVSGRFEYCFKNGMSTVTAKTVSFDVIVDDGRKPAGPIPSRTADDAALEAEIAETMHNLRSIRDNQQYLRVRERAHRDSNVEPPPHPTPVPRSHAPSDPGPARAPAAESTNTRIKVYSSFQVALLVVVCVFQLWYLRRFFEVKQVI